jgi:hypothetical protein
MLIIIFSLFLISPLTMATTIASEQMAFGSQEKSVNNDLKSFTYDLSSSYFTENNGQWDQEFKFMTNTAFGRVGFGSGNIYYDLVDAEFDAELGTVKGVGYVLKLNFESSNLVNPQGSGLVEHKNNYIYGKAPSDWFSGVDNFRTITYEELWPGIDLKFYFNDNGLKYDYILHPGADVNNIKIIVEGSRSLEMNNNDLIINTPIDRSIQDKGLIAYYDDNSPEMIDARFRILDDDGYTFLLGNYDSSRTIIIDPLIYSTYVSGSGWEHARAIDYDSSGNAYVTGFTLSTNFPTTTGAYDLTHNGGTDAYVFKLNPTGTSLGFCTFVGGSGSDSGYGIAVNSSSDIFVAGGTSSSNFPTAGSPFDSTHNGGYDAFVFKMRGTGASLSYSTFIGGASYDMARGLEIDGSGNAYIGGNTSSSNYPTSKSAYDTIFGGISDVFVTKLSANGNSLVYSTYIGGTSGDKAYDIAIDSAGNAYITGYADNFGGLSYPTTKGAYDTSGNLFEEVIVSKLNPTGNQLLLSTVVASSSMERGYGIDTDPSGNVYVAGWTRSSGFPTTTGAYQTTYKGTSGYSEGFVLKLNVSFDKLVYSTFLGDTHNDEVNDIDVDSNGIAYVIGSTGSTNFPVTSDAENKTHAGGTLDVFLTKFNAQGSALSYSTFRGGSSNDYGYAIAVDESTGNLYVAGVSSSTNFPTTNGAYSTTHQGSDDGIVFKFGISTPIPAPKNLKAVLGNNYVDLSWEAPLGAGQRIC